MQKNPASVFGLATGSTPLLLYRELIESYRRGDMSFAGVTSFNLDEYMGLAPDHPQSYRHFMNREFFEHIDIEPDNTHVPPGDADNPLTARVMVTSNGSLPSRKIVNLMSLPTLPRMRSTA